MDDISAFTVTFQEALERANIQSGDSLATAFGKLAKFCADMQDYVFSAPIDNLLSTDSTRPLAASMGKRLNDDLSAISELTDGVKSYSGVSWSLQNFLDRAFEILNKVSQNGLPGNCVNFRLKATSDWSPVGSETWIKGTFYCQNVSYDYLEIGQLLVTFDGALYFGCITQTSSIPQISWHKLV